MLGICDSSDQGQRLWTISVGKPAKVLAEKCCKSKEFSSEEESIRSIFTFLFIRHVQKRELMSFLDIQS